MKPRLLLACLISLTVASTLAVPLAPDSRPAYELYAIRYASIPDFPVSALVKGADPARKMEIAMVVWLIKGNGRNVLVDSGFYREQFFKQWKVKDFVRPSDAIGQAGVKP